jgi:hypothetical protein
MSINFSSNIVVNLKAGRVHGWAGGLGLYRMRFTVEYDTPPREERYIARNFRAIVDVSINTGKPMHLGTSWPESSWVLGTGRFVNQAAVLFDFDLTKEQLALIERDRNGGGLLFSLRILCEVSIGDKIESGYDDVRFSVNQSAWIDCMKSLGLDRIVLLEVELPLDSAGLDSATKLLKKARLELDAGNHDGVVQQCRLAIESVQNALELKPEINTAMQMFSGGDRKKMNKKERALVVNEAARHYAHPAHHVDADGQVFEYGRRDATFMLALASAIVANGAGGVE